MGGDIFGGLGGGEQVEKEKVSSSPRGRKKRFLFGKQEKKLEIKRGRD